MHNKIVLCKIAAEFDHASEDSVEVGDQLKIFKWDNKHWRMLFHLRTEDEFNLLMTILCPQQTDETSLIKCKTLKRILSIEVVTDEQAQSRFLAATFSTNHSSAHISLEEQMLFPIIFTNFVQPIGQQIGNVSTLAVEGDVDGSGEINIMQEYVTTALYDELYQKHSESQSITEEPLLALPDNFRPTLCRYQVQTVRWLLQREQQMSRFPNYYTMLRARDGETTVYKHLLSWYFQSEEPPLIELAPGGILADEMGLGKTVEILALIMLHPRQFETPAPLQVQAIEDVGPSHAKRERLESKFFCICASVRKGKSNLKQCSSCALQQHSVCVSRFNDSEAEEDYLCPSCWHTMSKNALLSTATTFVVTPHTIKAQWLSEIHKHIRPTLRVFDYNDVVAANWVSPRQLATYDVVITDYSVLRREIYHTSAYVSERVTRNEQRSMRRMSPLLMVQWWRVCLDEAQMVESNTSIVSAMVRQLPAVNRWAVTGTPVQRSIDDLRALLEFIGFQEPYTPLTGWRALLDDFVMQQNANTAVAHSPSRQLTIIEVLQRCMWRTCKSKVYSELKIPPQTEQVHRIRLSNLEKLFYSEQHALCQSSFQHVLQKYLGRAEAILKISPKIMKIILQPLLKIRQCCIIPVVSPGGGQHKYSATVQQKQFLQPKDLHAHLKSTNEIECKSELRTMASSYNGMAAIYFIRGEYEQAIRHYEMVLRLARDYKGINITVDSLLQIHALHNLQQACYSSPSNKSPLPADVIAKYEQEYNALEYKYLEPYASTMMTMRTSCLNAQEMLTKLESNVELPLLEYINMLVDEISMQTNQFATALLDRFHDEFAITFGGSPKLQELQSLRGILYILVMWYQKVDAAQKNLNAEFEKLNFYTMNVGARAQISPAIWRRMAQFVRSVYDCHLSEILDDQKGKEKEKAKREPMKSDQNLCKLCEIRNALNDYECLLFNKVVDKDTQATEGLENPSFEVALVKVVFTFFRTKAAFLNFLPQMDKQWEAIECRQQLCKKLIKYWIEIEYTVKAYDELDMCKMRISLAANEEEKTHFKLLEYELDGTFVEQQINLHNAQRQFAMKVARLKYITHLESNVTTGPCPICQSDDESRYTVLECGHNICLFCLRNIRKYNAHQKLCCPICRNQQSSEKIYYVTRITAAPTENTIQVVGDYSSKITYIVRLILQLQCDRAKDMDPLKILVFSQWTEILHPIAAALTQNGIRHRLKFTPRTIEEFKNPHLGVTCLLMPLRKGCNGLNLIAATHVFLVEPILNPAEEAQAIGRVHRFGQTRPTTVHRFIVCNTIEENIFNVVNAGKQSQTNWEFKQMSIENLRDLFHLDNDVTEDYAPYPSEAIDAT